MNFLFTLCIEIPTGVIDVISMFKIKVDKYPILSAFVYYLIVPFMMFEIPFVMTFMSIILGSMIGFVGHFLNLM